VPTYDESLYISVSEMAEMYRVKQSWIYDQISAGKIAAFQLPGKRGMHLLRSDVDQFMQPRRVNPPKDETA
jgi:excisionase family DNA binding protein